MGLGAASVKAQVRIGGNGAPNAAAVLDLNTNDATNTGTKTLALPRVSLASTTDLLGNTILLTGMLVYNTGGSLSAGIYYWDGSKWVIAFGSSTHGVDTTNLAPAPKNGSILVYYNSSWRTATNDTLIFIQQHVLANTNTLVPFNSAGCVSTPTVHNLGYGTGMGTTYAGLSYSAPGNIHLNTDQGAGWDAKIIVTCWRVH